MIEFNERTEQKNRDFNRWIIRHHPEDIIRTILEEVGSQCPNDTIEVDDDSKILVNDQWIRLNMDEVIAAFEEYPQLIEIATEHIVYAIELFQKVVDFDEEDSYWDKERG